MPLIQGRTSVAAASVVDNVLDGSQYEFIDAPAVVQFGLQGDANATDLRIDVYSGPDVLAENLEPGAAARIPIFPDDFTLEDIVGNSQRLKIRVRNLNASTARTLFHAVKITFL